jgi:hypothetical protein
MKIEGKDNNATIVFCKKEEATIMLLLSPSLLRCNKTKLSSPSLLCYNKNKKKKATTTTLPSLSSLPYKQTKRR